ncbi:hypothetical protein R1flu_000989 [Riccia fluitans]|uniref:Early light-induced protein n=1 Tax=Riccia fluitans TaxID=41844 RepID=A0ABD1Y2Z7_9MARC
MVGQNLTKVRLTRLYTVRSIRTNISVFISNYSLQMATVVTMMAGVSSARALSALPSSVALSSSHMPSLSTRRYSRIRCQAEPESNPAKSSPTTPAASVSTSATPAVTPITVESAVPKRPKVSTKFEDIFAFSGPAPETINGRLAMLGFVGALAVELGTGNSFTTQPQTGGLGLGMFTAAIFTVASLIPMFQGVTAESKSKSFWSFDAEKLNGRMAMVGLIALAITEYVNGTPLV